MLQKVHLSYGDRFSGLTVICEVEADYYKNNRRRRFLCRCDCGNETVIRLSNLTNGHTTSCGCKIIEKLIAHRRTHGKSKTRLHGIWAGMLNRCRNNHVKSYKNYGALGIRVCEEWLAFESFYKWAMDNGYKDDLTIERKDGDIGYEPLNCTWIPKSEQSKNRRCGKFITFQGKTQNIHSWAKELNIRYDTLRYRLSKGWDLEKALVPPKPGRKQIYDGV